MEREPLEGVGQADEHLGRPVPLPAAPVPLARWVDVVALGPGAVEIAWNLDDSRPGTPARLALYAGAHPPPDQGLAGAQADRRGRYAYRSAPLDEAQPSLRPVHELAWEARGLHLRLTGQGPWALDALVALADSTG